MTRRTWMGLVVVAVGLAGCEYAVSDVATRIRFALLAQATTPGAPATITLRPDHWPDGCNGDAGYRVVISPYAGNKKVAVGDIVVYCADGKRGYNTGLGSERIYVTKVLSASKRKDEDLRVTVRETDLGIEIVALE